MIIANMKFTMTINRRTLCSDTNDQYRFESCIFAAQIKRTSGERTEKKDRVEGKRSLLKHKNNLKFTLNPELEIHRPNLRKRNDKSSNKTFLDQYSSLRMKIAAAKLFASTHRVGECFSGEAKSSRGQKVDKTAPKSGRRCSDIVQNMTCIVRCNKTTFHSFRHRFCFEVHAAIVDDV